MEDLTKVTILEDGSGKNMIEVFSKHYCGFRRNQNPKSFNCGDFNGGRRNKSAVYW